MRHNKGTTMAEFVVGMGVASGIMVSLTVVYAFVLSWFNKTIEKNMAQQSPIQSAYYLKFLASQAVKSKCCAGVNCAGLPSAGYTAIPNDYTMVIEAGIPPLTVAGGVFDCRNEGNNWIVGRPNPLALFVREDGGAVTTIPASNYLVSGIYFEPPTGNNSGQLYFMTGALGGTISPSPAGLIFDKLVNVGVVPSSITNSPAGRLGSLTLRVTARYYVRNIPDADKTYLPGAVNNGFTDIDMHVPISLRNNWLGLSPVLAGTAERLNGNVYYFKLMTPKLETLQF